MENIHSVALYVFIVFYIVYVVVAALALVKAVLSVRRKASRKSRLKLTSEAGRLSIPLEAVFILATVMVSIYAMSRWIFGQLLEGCMHIGWWNPGCYDMNNFNRSWFAVFVVVALNAMMLSLIYDTKRQNKKFSR